jgi:hypothetical protein
MYLFHMLSVFDIFVGYAPFYAVTTHTSITFCNPHPQMFCSLSGGAPSDAVVSAKTGHLYERFVIS